MFMTRNIFFGYYHRNYINLSEIQCYTRRHTKLRFAYFYIMFWTFRIDLFSYLRVYLYSFFNNHLYTRFPWHRSLQQLSLTKRVPTIITRIRLVHIICKGAGHEQLENNIITIFLLLQLGEKSTAIVLATIIIIRRLHEYKLQRFGDLHRLPFG